MNNKIIALLIIINSLIVTSCAQNNKTDLNKRLEQVNNNTMQGGKPELSEINKLAYINNLQQHIKSKWKWSNKEDLLRAIVEVKIAPDGKISSSKIIQSSGNSSFDDSVISVIQKASPVPTPPQESYSMFSKVRFVFDSTD